MVAALALAEKADNYTELLPSISDIREVSQYIAMKVAQEAIDEGVATAYTKEDFSRTASSQLLESCLSRIQVKNNLACIINTVHWLSTMRLHNSNILLGVTGGIAACKVPLLIRALRLAGAHVRVCMTDNAHHFVTSLTLQTLTGLPVLNNQFVPEQDDGMDHISLARWADMIVIAPATAGVIARCAQGMADDLLTSICLASEAPKMVVPAMNRVMWQQPQVQRNLDLIRSYGWDVSPVASGEQACGEYGEGRMLEPDNIIDHLTHLNNSEQVLAEVRVVITAGPTREPSRSCSFYQ